MGIRLYVDDERPCPDGWTLARTHAEALAILHGGDVVAVSLDHDLGTEMTGYDLATEIERMAAEGLPVPVDLSVHSANPVGRRRIEQCFASIARFVGSR